MSTYRAWVLSAALVLSPAGAATAPSRPTALAAAGDVDTAAGVYRSPTASGVTVVNSFDEGVDPYAAGHRGVDLALPVGAQVLAAGAGTVRFAGAVAGRSLVVLRHPDGVSTEYEPLTIAVRSGQSVTIGQVIGTLSASHPGCSRTCLHWGAQRAGRYFDPLSLLRPLGIVRLVPCQARGWACS